MSVMGVLQGNRALAPRRTWSETRRRRAGGEARWAAIFVLAPVSPKTCDEVSQDFVLGAPAGHPGVVGRSGARSIAGAAGGITPVRANLRRRRSEVPLIRRPEKYNNLVLSCVGAQDDLGDRIGVFRRCELSNGPAGTCTAWNRMVKLKYGEIPEGDSRKVGRRCSNDLRPGPRDWRPT
jgi:hypothetical protein